MALYLFRFVNAQQAEDCLTLVLQPGTKQESKVLCHREINVIASSEAQAREKAARRKLDETRLPDSYRLVRTFTLGANWR